MMMLVKKCQCTFHTSVWLPHPNLRTEPRKIRPGTALFTGMGRISGANQLDYPPSRETPAFPAASSMFIHPTIRKNWQKKNPGKLTASSYARDRWMKTMDHKRKEKNTRARLIDKHLSSSFLLYYWVYCIVLQLMTDQLQICRNKKGDLKFCDGVDEGWTKLSRSFKKKIVMKGQ